MVRAALSQSAGFATAGTHRQTNDYTVAMPAFKDELSNAQIAAVANRAGGPTPMIVRIAPWLTGFAVLVVCLAVLATVLLIRRRRTL